MAVALGAAILASSLLPAPPPAHAQVDLGEQRAYELVSPAYKVGGVGVGPWYMSVASAASTGSAAQIGERFVVVADYGSTLLGTNGFAFKNDYALAERTAEGWVQQPGINRPAYGDHALRAIGIGAAQPDLAHMTWSDSGLIKLFPEMELWPSTNQTADYVSSWAGDWELSVPTDPAQSGGGSTPHLNSLIAREAPVVVSNTGYRGVAGPGDPTSPSFGDLQSGKSIYLQDLSGGLSNEFPGTARTLVNTCTGAGGERTELPARDGSGELGAVICPEPGAGRDETLLSPGGAELADGRVVARTRIVSDDGRRVFFHAPDFGSGGVPTCSGTGTETECAPQLYVRQRNPGGEDVVRWISRPEVEGQDASLLGPAVFEGASADGSRVFFRTSSALTADDPNGEGAPTEGGVTSGSFSGESWDLYMYEFPPDPEDDPGDGTLTRISAGPSGESDCNSPFGPETGVGGEASAALRSVSDDGEVLYFTCAAPLEDVPEPDNGTITSQGGAVDDGSATNLYAYDAGEPLADRWRFVARLPRATGSDPRACATTALTPTRILGSDGGAPGRVLTFVAANCVRSTDDGRFSTFWTPGQLTADDPDGSSLDIYAYDHDAGELTRITAATTGSGGTYDCTAGGAAGFDCHGDGGFGGTTPPPLGLVSDPDDPSERVAFFQTRSQLVAEDTDDAYDVYQWRNGELSLLTVDTELDATYNGNEANGRNVYFATRERLSWQDSDAVQDIYTLRIGGGIPEPPEPELCAVLADECQGAGDAAPPPPEFATAGGS